VAKKAGKLAIDLRLVFRLCCRAILWLARCGVGPSLSADKKDPMADEREDPNAARLGQHLEFKQTWPTQSGAFHDDTGCIGIRGQPRRFLQEASRWSQRPFLLRTGR
jgi:hypothetical protein